MKDLLRTLGGVCVLAFGLLAMPAVAQEGPFQPWVGEQGITETVEQIMARDRLTKKWTPADGLIEADEREEPDRTRLPSDPNAPAVSQWPPLPDGMDPKSRFGHNGGPFNPQTLGTEFNGPTLGSSGFVPPDTQGAVGPTQVVLCANGRITSYTKAGAVSGINTTMDTFFNSVRAGSSISDPQVRYDVTSGRWFVIGITTNQPNRVTLAVSSGSTITNTASFTFFFFQWDTVTPTNGSDTGGFYDYPSLGVDANALYIGGNVFNPSFNGCSCFVVKKSSMTSGGPIQVTAFRRVVASSGGAGPYSPRGVDNWDPAATEGYIIGVANNAFSRLTIRRITNPGGTPSISADLNITVPTTVNPQGQVALGTTGTLDALDDRLFAAAVRKNRYTGVTTLWTAHNIEVNASGAASTSGNRNGSRWYQLGNLTGTPSLVQSGTVFDPAASNQRGYWIPSVNMSGQGHMALGASFASAAVWPGCAVTGRLDSDTLGTTQAITDAQAGGGAYNAQGSGTQRWGDYSAVAVDPTDDQTMWAMIEYSSSSNNWAVRTIQLKAPGPATPVTCSPSTLTLGATNVPVVVTGTSSGGTAFYDTAAGFNRLVAGFSGGGITVNSVTLNSQTQVTLNVTVSGSAGTGPRSLTITNPDGQLVTSASGILTIDSSSVCPSFTTNPSSQTVCEGQPVTFVSVANGTPAPTYQWRKNTVNIPGATNASYTIPSVVSGDAGSYDCVATNSCGNATSTAATLGVNQLVNISGITPGGTICAGSPFSFTVTATGSPTLTYQWRKNTINIPGANAVTYNILSATSGDSGSYDCVVTNGCGSATSGSSSLTVNTAAGVSSNPSDTAVLKGGTALFSMTASGTVPVSYQWRKNGVNLVDDVRINGSTTANLSISPVDKPDEDTYDCVVTNSCGNATTVGAFLTVICPADYDGSGFVDFDDYTLFVSDFEAGLDQADFDGSGFVDFDDFISFSQAFESGC